jgi:hypothetical protein
MGKRKHFASSRPVSLGRQHFRSESFQDSRDGEEKRRMRKASVTHIHKGERCMIRKSYIVWTGLTLLALTLAACQPVTAQTSAATTASDAGAGTLPGPVLPTDAVEMQIANAKSAAPAAVANDATILGWPAEEGGEMVVLHEGSNKWTCIADWPASPGNDPACYDPIWMAWNDAYAAGEEPEVTKPGIAYMLQGGSDPSNTDPMALAPAEGEEWVTSLPHIMVLVPGGFDPTDFTTDHHSGEPYIMWEGTPYEHLMTPVLEGEASMQE